MFLFGRRKKQPLIRGNTPGEQFLRFVALIGIFVGAGWLFWLNAEDSMEKIEAKGTVVDMGDALNSEQRQMLRDMGKLFKSEFGLELKVQVSVKHLQPPPPDGKTIYFGINPQTRRVELQLPPLVGNALGPRFIEDLTRNHFTPYFDRDAWPEGLLQALKDIWQQLISLQPSMSSEYRFPINTSGKEANTTAPPPLAQ